MMTAQLSLVELEAEPGATGITPPSRDVMTQSTHPPPADAPTGSRPDRRALIGSREQASPPSSRRSRSRPLKPDGRPLRQLLPPTSGPWPVLNALLELERIMRDRIACEEGKAGLFDFLCRAAPRYVSLIEHLRLEHQRILHDIETLHTRGRHCHDMSQLSLDLNQLIDAIDDHEAFEREILRDSIES